MSSTTPSEPQLNTTKETAATVVDAWDEPYEATTNTSVEAKAEDPRNERCGNINAPQAEPQSTEPSRCGTSANDRYHSKSQLPLRPESRQGNRHPSDGPRQPPQHNARHETSSAHPNLGGTQATLLARLSGPAGVSSWGTLAARAERFAPTNNHAIRTGVDNSSGHSREVPTTSRSLGGEASNLAPKIDPVQRPGLTRDAGWNTKPRVEQTQPPKPQPAAPKTTSNEVAASESALMQPRTVAQPPLVPPESPFHPRDANGESDLLRHIVFLSAPPKHSKAQDGDSVEETMAPYWSETQLSSYWSLLDTMKSCLGKADAQAKQDTALHAIVKHFPVAQKHGDYKGKKPTCAVLDAVYDLCEETSSEVRKMGYRALGALSKHVDGKPFERNVDILCQILANRCSSHEMDCLSRAVLDHLEKSPVQTLKVMLAFLANNIVELEKAADRVRANILRILAVDAHDFFTYHYGRELPPTSTMEVADVETEAEFLDWLRQTVMKCQTNTDLGEVFTLASHFARTLWMPDVDRASCPEARRILALRQRWIDTLAIKLVAQQRNTSFEVLDAATELTCGARKDASLSQPLPMALMLLACCQMEQVLVDSAPIAQDVKSPPQQSENRSLSVGAWRLPKRQREHHNQVQPDSAASLLETLSTPTQILVAGSMIAAARTVESPDAIRHVGRDVAAAISWLVPRSEAKEQVDDRLCPLEHLVIGESLLWSLLEIVVSEPKSNAKPVAWYIASQHDLQSRLRAFQKTVDRIGDALGIREKDSRSLSTSTDGDRRMETLLDMVSSVTANLGLCLGELSGMALNSEGDLSWLAKANGTVKDVADRLQWERWLLSMGDHQGWADVKALFSRVPLKRELKPLPRVSLNHGSSERGPSDREPRSQKAPTEPEPKDPRSERSGIAAERGTKRRASEDVGSSSSAWKKAARHADAGDRRRTDARRPEDTEPDYVSNASRGSPFSLDDVLTQKAFAKLKQGDFGSDLREGQNRREIHGSISIRGKGASTREEEAGGEMYGKRWKRGHNHEGLGNAGGEDLRRTAYDGMGRSDGRGPHPHAPHNRHGRARMADGAPSSGVRSERRASHDVRDNWW